VATTSATVVSRTEQECVRAAGLLALGATGAGVLLWARSFPGWPLTAGVIFSVLVIAGVLLVSGVMPPAPARWLRPLGVVAALAVVVVGGVLVERSAGAALQARFAASRPAFDSLVDASGPVPVEETDHWLPFPGACPTQLGSYRIEECHAFTGGFMFLQGRDAWGDDAGFAYVPQGLPNTPDGQALPSTGFTHLVGPWYAWSCRC
jgi:hypothetical protein